MKGIGAILIILGLVCFGWAMYWIINVNQSMFGSQGFDTLAGLSQAFGNNIWDQPNLSITDRLNMFFAANRVLLAVIGGASTIIGILMCKLGGRRY